MKTFFISKETKSIAGGGHEMIYVIRPVSTPNSMHGYCTSAEEAAKYIKGTLQGKIGPAPSNWKCAA